MSTTSTKGTAAAQEAAAPTETPTASVETTTATVTTFKVAKRNPPMQKAPKAAKEVKEPKRLTGVLVRVGTCSYNHWRQYVNEGINSNVAEGAVPLACWRKPGADEAQLPHKWDGYISVAPAHVEAVVAALNAHTTSQNALPVEERTIVMWQMLEHFQTVEPAPRAPRTKKATAETEATETATTEATETATETTEVAEATETVA